MNTVKKVLIFGAAGRVGLGLTNALMGRNIDICAADFVGQQRLDEKISRAIVDARISYGKVENQVSVYGGIDVLDEEKVTELLIKEQPDVVVNYAIPFTWDAAKQLPNYSRISQAGLGAFAPAQVLAPKIIAQALKASGIKAKYIVGNLPDITIPIIYGLNKHQPLALPLAGAGNVGLIEAGLKHQIAKERELKISELSIFLVAHHVHWVAPREPGYKNDAPFLMKVCYQGKDITQELGNLRELMNRSIVNCYEAGAGFSSTTSLLAAKLVLSLLDEEKSHSIHSPSPNGLPGGYPVTIKNGAISLALPAEWQKSEAIALMKQAHQRDGIDKITEDGCIHFALESVEIMKQELGIDLPEILMPSELDAVAKEQIQMAQRAIATI